MGPAAIKKLKELDEYTGLNLDAPKSSTKANGIIRSYAANTSVGIVRKANEDRVSIIINIPCPESKRHVKSLWRRISFFAIFDGHGGDTCAEYLRDNLHIFII